MPSTKTLRVTLSDIVGGTGGSGSTAVVHARYVTANGRGRDVHLTDGTIVVPVRRSVTPGTGPEEFDFTVIPSENVRMQVGGPRPVPPLPPPTPPPSAAE